MALPITLSIYPRHTDLCLQGDGVKPGLIATLTQRNQGQPPSDEQLRDYKRCMCPKYFTGKDHAGKWWGRTSVGKCSWLEAVLRVGEQIGLPQTASPVAAGKKDKPLSEALDAWMASISTGNDQVSRTSLRGYRQTEAALRKLGADQHLELVDDCTPAVIDDWQRSWTTLRRRRGAPKTAPSVARPLEINTHRNQLARLRHFFGYCFRLGFATENVMKKIIAPKSRRRRHNRESSVVATGVTQNGYQVKTMPLDEEGHGNYDRVINSVSDYFSGELMRRAGKLPRQRTSLMFHFQENFRAGMELMYATGLRDSDNVNFRLAFVRERSDGRGIYTTDQLKTGHPVTVVIPAWLLAKLKVLPEISPGYLFWDGILPQEDFANRHFGKHLFEMNKYLKLPRLHPHMFRDSFAVNKLNAGWEIARVSQALGHRSASITEQYYNPWVKSRQDAYIADCIATENVIQFPKPGKSRRRA